jgi:hypothetical protein
MSDSNNTNSGSSNSGNLQGQLDLEKDINKELLKKLEGFKADKEEESEKYRILALAFEELYQAHSDVLKQHGHNSSFPLNSFGLTPHNRVSHFQ